MKRLALSLPLLLVVVLSIASLPRVFLTAAQEATPASPSASPAAGGTIDAPLQDVTGADVGSVTMTEANGQVTLTINVTGMPPR